MTPPAPVPGDAARGTLRKAAHENFPVAPLFLPRSGRAELMAVYGYARLVDDIGDGDLDPAAGDPQLLGVTTGCQDRGALLDAVERELGQVFAGSGTPRHPLLAALVPVVQRHSLTSGPFAALIAANRQDQHVHRYETYEELLGYCELSANPVGRLVLAVTGSATPLREKLSDQVCTALQLVEHLQDVAEDLARGRVYLPAEDMRRFEVSETDLKAPSASPQVRRLIAFEADRAERLLRAGAPLVHSVEGRLRLLLAGFLGGGLATLHALRAASCDVLATTPRPRRSRVLRETAALWKGHRRP